MVRGACVLNCIRSIFPCVACFKVVVDAVYSVSL